MKHILIILMLLPVLAFGQMVKTGVVRTVVTGGGSYTTKYQAVLDAMTNKPSSTNAGYQNDMVSDLVDDGYWNRMELLYVFAQESNSDDEAQINWIAPGTYDCVESGAGALTFTSLRGLKGDGTNLLNTSFNPSADSSIISWDNVSFGLYIRDNVSEATYDIGLRDPSTGSTLSFAGRWTGDVNYFVIFTTSAFSRTSDNSSGMMMISRRGMTDSEYYRNGSSLETYSTVPYATLPDNALYIFNRNGHSGKSTKEISIVFLMDGITDADVTALNTIFETYMDAIGAGIQ